MCSNVSFALGLLAGLRESKLLRSEAPTLVRVENLERMIEPWLDFEAGGKRSVRAFGRRLKAGQLSSVGIPQSSRIYTFVNEMVRTSYLLLSSPLRGGLEEALTLLN